MMDGLSAAAECTKATKASSSAMIFAARGGGTLELHEAHREPNYCPPISDR